MARSFSGSSADDLMRHAIQAVLKFGEGIQPTKGQALELQSVMLELTNPRARLSRSEARGKVFSCLRELCWYLSGSNLLEDIEYYIPRYRDYAEGAQLYGAYGPRLFDFNGRDQIQYVIGRLTSNPDSRQAVIQIFDHRDVVEPHEDVPCTCSLQFLIRTERLQLITYMRSNDAYKGLPHDIFAFTMLQELVARSLGLEMGSYVHMVGSFHLYEPDIDPARAFLSEGWQSEILMPSMPEADPWPSVRLLLDVAKELRDGSDPLAVEVAADPYWQDLSRLLAIFALHRTGRHGEIPSIRRALQTPMYGVFLDDKFGPLVE